MATKTKDNAPAEEKAPEIDPGPLSFSDAQTVITGRGPGAASEKTSVFDDVIKESYETEKVKEFTVPTGAAKTQMTALRSAGNRLNVGLRVRSADHDNGTTTIQFLARDKKWRKAPGQETAPASQETAPADGADAPSDGA